MASIFLSYDRDDEPRARPVAAVLERAGHSVWWDRQIRGGREFAAEIEAALNAADKVVVLWSRRAVKSAWVRDEAAVGRDSGRLVPATLDGTLPPLGFRQFQTVDLSKVRGRARSSQMATLIEAVAATEIPGFIEPPKARRLSWRPERPLLLGVLGILLLAASAAVAILLWRSAATAGQPRIAISPADSSPLSRQVAHDLTLALPRLGGGNSSAYELIDASDGRAPRAGLVMTVNASSSGGRERRDISLRAPDEAILWSASIDEPTAASANLPQQLAVQAQRALSCAADVLSYRRERIGRDTLTLYLSGCPTFDYALDTNLDYSDQVKLFEQVIAKAPHFEPAWAKLFTLEIDELMSLSVDNPGQLAEKMRGQVAHAEKLGLDFGELYAAKAISRPPNDFIGMFRTFAEGIRRHPDSDILYRLNGYRSLFVGRMRDSVDLTAHAVQLNPLSPVNQETLASAYVYAGSTDAGFAQLRKAEALWPGVPSIVAARTRLNLRYGDPKQALASLEGPTSEGAAGRQPEQVAFLRARIDPTPDNIDRAIAETRKIYKQDPAFIEPIVQTLAQFGRKDEVLDILLHYEGGVFIGISAEVLFRPALRDVWRDPRSIAAAAHLGLLHYWKASGLWPDFCSDPTLPYDCKKEAARYRV